MGKRIIKLGEETDWWFTNNRNLYAVNRDSRMFENTSYTQGMVMELYRDEDENDVANALGARLRDCREYEYVIYDASHHLVGFVYYPEEDEQGKKEPRTRVYRFHAHTWVDVIVNENELDLEGLTEEQVDAEFAMKAEDKYNEGDYADDPSNFENTDMEEVTDSYVINNFYGYTNIISKDKV